MEGSKEDQAVQAWETLLGALRAVGAYQSVVFQDGRISRCVELMGGWRNACLWDAKELSFKQRDFIQLYKSLPPSPPLKLAGIVELTNSMRGYLEHIPKSILIGEEGRKLIENNQQFDMLEEGL